jgi:DNA-binding transcriptional LysR family regulator
LVRVLPDWEFGDQYAARQAVAAYLPTPYLPRKVRAFIDHIAN